MNAIEWLATTTKNLEGKEVTQLEELAQLIGMNGGMAWKGYGVMAVGGPYGRMGLSFEEAMRLLYLSGVLDGFTKAHGSDDTKTVVEAIKAEIRKAGEKKQPTIVGADGQPLARS